MSFANRLKVLSVLLSAATVLAGCSSIERANAAKKAADPIAADAAIARPARCPDLVGASLETLVGFALTNRPSVVSARLAVTDARLALKAIAADAPIVSETPWTAPHLSLSGGHSESSAGTHYDDGDFDTRGNASGALSLDLLVWDFGRNAAEAKAQAEKVVAAERSLVAAGYTVFGEVASAYFTYHEKGALLAVAESNLVAYAEQCAYAEARFDAGEADRLDVVRARLDKAQAEQSLIEASNNLVTAGATLKHALGADASLDAAEKLVGPASGRIDGTVCAFSRTTATADEVFGESRTNAPSMRVLRAQVRAAQHNVDYAKADLMPTFSISVSMAWTDPLWIFKWGINGTQTIFQGFRKTTALDRAVVALESSVADVAASEQELRKKVDLAVAVRDNAVESLRAASVSVTQAEVNRDTVLESWRVGDVNRIEVTTALSAHAKALGDRVTAFYDGQRAEAALFVLAGRYPAYEK